MTRHIHAQAHAGSPAENYQLYFVPSIAAPMADDLIESADLRPGQRVLDVACGTGVVARRAAERVGASGVVAGLDVNPGMLAVARSLVPTDRSIEWLEASAESMPLPDRAFDVVLCQMGLQFVPDRLAALREMQRVLDAGGRALISLPGPTPPIFAIMADALARHAGPDAAAFVARVFSLHDAEEIAGLMRRAGFREVDVRKRLVALRLPAPADFLWQYVHSTPLADAAARMGESGRDAFEQEVCAQWQSFVADGSLSLEVGMTTATGFESAAQMAVPGATAGGLVG